MAKVTLETERLRLREFKMSDFDAVHVYASDLEITQYMSFGPNSEAETKAFLQRTKSQRNVKRRTNYTLAITLKETGQLIGGCSIFLNSGINRDGEIGYVINKDYHRQGYAPEASRAMIEFALSELKLHRIYAFHHPDNLKSGKVMQKIGMHDKGMMRKSHWIKKEWWDFHVYSILESDPIL